jgi:hypothetical protein
LVEEVFEITMIISHSHRFIFVKSAKTAGTSLESALSNHCSGDDVVTPLGDYRVNRDEEGNWVHKSMNAGDFEQHDHGITIRNKVPADVWNSYFKFSIARNPWDRVLSLFFWKHRNDPALRPRKRFYHHLGIRFDALAPTRALFSNFVVNEDWETNDRFYIIDDRLCVDFVIRYESLGDGFGQVCDRIGIPVPSLPNLKVGIRAKGHHYSEYYDDAAMKVVAERHRNDIRLLGYAFEKA